MGSASSPSGNGRALRVLHCPTTCGGNPQQLARAERAIGLASWAVAFGDNRLGYECDELVSGRAHVELKRWELLWRALSDFDIVHFNMGRSLFPPLVTSFGTITQRYSSRVHRLYQLYAQLLNMNDLRLLERAGKGIVVTFQGGDARPGAYSAAGEAVGAERRRADAWRRRAINKFDRYAHRIYYLNPDLGRHLPARASFLPYANVDLDVWRPRKPAEAAAPTVIHAPTVRGSKGTEHVLAAADALKAEGIPFELVLVEGLSRSEARHLYERSDLLVDQLGAGWYGGVAVECMALGKPVICHIREDDLRVIPEQMRNELPIIRADPSTLTDVLRDCLTRRRHELREIGARSRAYVEGWHDPLGVARALKREYEDVLASKRGTPAAR